MKKLPTLHSSFFGLCINATLKAYVWTTDHMHACTLAAIRSEKCEVYDSIAPTRSTTIALNFGSVGMRPNLMQVYRLQKPYVGLPQGD